MESSRAAQAEKEYSAQHFGFDPTWLVDGFAEDSLRHVTETLGKLKNEIHFMAHFFKSLYFTDESSYLHPTIWPEYSWTLTNPLDSDLAIVKYWV